MQHVLIAPDKFKGSLTASEVAAHLAEGLRRVRPEVPVETMPVADGGDGTVEAAVACGFTRVEATVTGPTGRPVTAAYALRGDTAVIEMAEASGLRRLPGGRLEPLTATSRGTGELIAAALDAGAARVVLGLGGSACTDGGAGLVEALGARLLDSRGRPLPAGGAALRDLHTLDLGGLRKVPLIIASDVDNPLLGPNGAAEVYGPQKGALPADLRVLEAGLARWAEAVARALAGQAGGAAPGRAGALSPGRAPAAVAATGRASSPPGRTAGGGGRSAEELAALPGAGAAGGVGFAALTLLGGTFQPGIAYLLDLLGFADRAAGARLVITGEGSLDRQSLSGKAPVGVARAAVRAGARVVAVAGRKTLTGEQLRRARIDAAYALTDLEPDVDTCIAEAGPLLERLAERIAQDWLTPDPATPSP
ncbi:glycerate kinase [Bailinhaonella thermotolerans]|uniref:glycerate kinase n=1 Tax=Bailinhaonella thermotolerans TaxID=1070861 RepID=UPI001F5BB0CA|nr:glycerate kinase [Bailinhaonella thermotolerans]